MKKKKSLELLLPPSVNSLYMNKAGSYKRILKGEGRTYIYVYAMEIKAILRKMKHKPIDDYFHLDIEWWLPNRNCDSHNYEKALLDMLEKSGFVTNDKYIMARTQAVAFDKKKPRIIIYW